MDSGQLPGAISVLYNNGVQETCCIGYADPRTKRPITMDDVFMQCSQTKGFCGVTIAKLVEEGKISLDNPVSKYQHNDVAQGQECPHSQNVYESYRRFSIRMQCQAQRCPRRRLVRRSAYTSGGIHCRRVAYHVRAGNEGTVFEHRH